MSIYSDKLAHLQVDINCQYSVAQMCTREDMLAHILYSGGLNTEHSNSEYSGDLNSELVRYSNGPK